MTADTTASDRVTGWELDRIRARVEHIRATRTQAAVIAAHRVAGRHRATVAARAHTRPPKPLPGPLGAVWTYQGHTHPLLVRAALDVPRWPLALLWAIRARRCHHPILRATTAILWTELAVALAVMAVTAWTLSVPLRVVMWTAGEALVLRGWTRPAGPAQRRDRFRVGQRDRAAAAAGRMAEIRTTARKPSPVAAPPAVAPAPPTGTGQAAMTQAMTAGVPTVNGAPLHTNMTLTPIYEPYSYPVTWPTGGRAGPGQPIGRRLIKRLWWTSVAVGALLTLAAWTLALLSAAGVIGAPPTFDELEQRTTPTALIDQPAPNPAPSNGAGS